MARALPSEPVLFMLAADLAELFSRKGLRARTPQAIRQGRRDGRFPASGQTPRGVGIWLIEDAERLAQGLIEEQRRVRERWA